MDNFSEMKEEYAKWFTHKPARACVAVKQLPFGVPASSASSRGVEDSCKKKISPGNRANNIVQVEIEATALQ